MFCGSSSQYSKLNQTNHDPQSIKMPHVIIYCSFRKLRDGKTHIITQDDGILQTLEAKPNDGLLANDKDYVIKLAPTAVLDRLEQFGYQVIASSTFTEGDRSHHKSYVMWTLRRNRDQFTR